MLQQLTHIIIVSVICIIWGLPAFIYCTKRGIEKSWLSDGIGSWVFLFFCGIVSLSLISSMVVLLAPLQFQYLLSGTILLLFFLIAGFKKTLYDILTKLRDVKKPSTPVFIFGISCILLFIVLGTLKPVNIDTQLYHLQIIRWTNEYGTVPGLANLYPRLGLGSNWFNLISFFHIPVFGNTNFTFLNSTIAIWFMIWLLHKWNFYLTASNDQLNKAYALFFFLLLIYFLFDWQLFRDTANSTSYDFIVTALTIMVLTYILENSYKKEVQNYSPILLLFSLTIIPFKLSGIFILFPIFFYLTGFGKMSIWVKSIVTGIIVLIPLFLKNYFITGYPLFPSTLLSGNPDWKLPLEMTERFQEYVLYVNKFYNNTIGFIFSYDKTAFNWIPFWFDGILIKHKALLLLSASSLILLIKNRIRKTNLFIISLWLMFAGWFFTAPDPRFAYGFLLLLAFFPISIMLSKYFSGARLYSILLLMLTPIILYYTFKKSEPILKDNKYLFTVIQNDIPPYKEKNSTNGNYYEPEKIYDNWNNRCFYTPLPCICEENPYLQKRGNVIKKRFQDESNN